MSQELPQSPNNSVFAEFDAMADEALKEAQDQTAAEIEALYNQALERLASIDINPTEEEKVSLRALIVESRDYDLENSNDAKRFLEASTSVANYNNRVNIINGAAFGKPRTYPTWWYLDIQMSGFTSQLLERLESNE